MTADVPHPSPGLSESTLERLAAAKHVAVLTGAGMSADSGLPTYRTGADALWSSVVANAASGTPAPNGPGFGSSPTRNWSSCPW